MVRRESRMLERLQFLVVYVGSAAMAAFLAVCFSSAQVFAYPCDAIGAIGAEQCDLPATLTLTAAIPEAGMMNAEHAAEMPHRESVTTAASD